MEGRVGWGPGQAWPVGQDAALAAGLAGKFVTVGGIVQATLRAIDAGIDGALRSRPLAQDSPLARSHGTDLPILQGPMTCVSDVPAFAEAIGCEGGLPFIALALLKRPDVEQLLAETAQRMAGRPWGVGLLGFAPPERAQGAACGGHVGPAALCPDRGRPSRPGNGVQRHGIITYLHVPSPGFSISTSAPGPGGSCSRGVNAAATSGLGPVSCSGSRHVGFSMRQRASGVAAQDLSVVFAGGIHDARSAALVAALAGDLAAKGVKVGILMGTAYLFTREAVSRGAIVQRFQDEALRCQHTVLLESGPGHLVRVSPTPFVDRFNARAPALLAEGRMHEEVREELERMNLGRLRLAAKGVAALKGPARLWFPPLIPSRRPAGFTCWDRLRRSAIG